MLQEMNAGRYKTAPYKHQLRCLAEHGHKPEYFLSAEQGTGKTWIIINNCADLWDANECDALLVFAPNGVHTNWTLQELPKHMPDWVTWRAAAWRAGMGKADAKKFEEIFGSKVSADKRELRILTMNWESLDHKRPLEVAMRFASSAAKLMIVCDEPSGAIKNPTSQRFKNLLKLKYMSRWRRMTDGTPITQGPFDAFAPYNFLNKNILETESFYAFKAEYAEMIPAETLTFDDNGQPVMRPNPMIKHIMDRQGTKRIPQIVQKGAGGLPKYKNLEKLQKLIAPYTFRVLKSECLDLPKKIYKTSYFQLTPEQKEVYRKAEKECRLVYQNNEAPIAKLTAVTKLAQITAGFFIHPDIEEPVAIPGPNPKLELLAERVGSIVRQGSKVIVWARFHAEIDAIRAVLKAAEIPTVEYHGRVKQKDREAAKVAFQADAAVPGSGWAQAMIAQQQAGGTGNTWTDAAYTIYFSNTFSLRERLQSEDRNHRIGQEEEVVYLDLVAEGTVDAKIVAALASKKNVADIINGDGKHLFPEVPF